MSDDCPTSTLNLNFLIPLGKALLSTEDANCEQTSESGRQIRGKV